MMVFYYIIYTISPECYCAQLTHLAPECFEKLAFKKNKNATLKGCISKARANSELKLTFSESSFKTGRLRPLQPPLLLPAVRGAQRVKLYQNSCEEI